MADGPYKLLGGFWPGGPLCFVDFEHFARFAEWWLETGTGLPADLYEDENNVVNSLDLDVFVDEWLDYCPYNWPVDTICMQSKGISAVVAQRKRHPGLWFGPIRPKKAKKVDVFSRFKYYGHKGTRRLWPSGGFEQLLLKPLSHLGPVSLIWSS
jgi:hypothetical protein